MHIVEYPFILREQWILFGRGGGVNCLNQKINSIIKYVRSKVEKTTHRDFWISG